MTCFFNEAARRYRRIFALIAAFSAVFALNAHELRGGGGVISISDGDTIKILDSGKISHKIRLNKIDAPEKGQAYGEGAKKHLSSLIAGKDVRVIWEKEDRYGRILGEVFLGETNINLQMVKDGYAWHYKYYDSTPAYAEAEKEARAAKRGLWRDPNPIQPYEFRKKKRNFGIR